MAYLIPNLSDRQMIGSHLGSSLDSLIKIPDRSTIWLFRERLSKSGKDTDIWNKLQCQLDLKGLTIKEGMIQDATFIDSDLGHAFSDTPRGSEAKTRRSKDGTWTKKGVNLILDTNSMSLLAESMA